MKLLFIEPEPYILGYTNSRYKNYETNDCVVKAFAILFGITYDEAHGFSRGYFNRAEQDGTANFAIKMTQMIRNSNASFNGTIEKISFYNGLTTGRSAYVFNRGVYLILTYSHVSVLIDGIWLDYQGNISEKMKIEGVYKFTGFPHYNELRRQVKKEIKQHINWLYIAFCLLILCGLFFKREIIQEDLNRLIHWIKYEVIK
jgi:hypothetical protein